MVALENWDALKMPWSGIAAHGNRRFDTTLISEIEDGLYLGGCVKRVKLPAQIEYVVSLYPWEAYTEHENVKGVFSLALYDAELTEGALGKFRLAADVVNEFWRLGPTLVHCQAGLNRSSFTLVLALMKHGYTPAEAILLLREKRSPACLCNPYFEQHLLAQEK